MERAGDLDSYTAWTAVRPRAPLALPLAAALFAVAASLALRLPTLALLPPWGDEVLTLRAIELPPLKMMAERMRQMHSPTYFFLLQALGLDGNSLFLLRLPSALADSLAAGLSALVAYRLGGWRAGVILGLFYACMPVLVEEAQDARPYGLFFGFLALFTWATARLLEHPRLATSRRFGRPLRWTWVAAFAGAIGLVNMLPLGLFAVLAVDLAVFWQARHQPARRLLRPWLWQRLLSLVALAPLFYGFLRYVGRFAGNYWYSPSLDRLLVTLSDSAGAGVEHDPDRFLGPEGNWVLLLLFLALVALGLLWGRRRRSFALVLFLAFGTQAALIAVSQHTSVYVVRYFAIATPALTLLAALGLAGLWRRRASMALLLGAVTLVLLFLQAFDAMHQLNKPRVDLAAAQLDRDGVARVGVFVENNYLPPSVLYHLADRPRGRRLSQWDMLWAGRQGVTLWVVDYAYRRVHPAWALVAARAGLKSCKLDLRGVTVLEIAPSLRPESCLPAKPGG